MIYELFLEGQLADIRQDLGMQLSYNIDDVNKYGSRDTSFSKTIVLPGTAKNNKLFGFVGELGSNNPYANGAANIDANFNVAQTTKAELRANGLLLLKGVFRLTGIIHERGHIEYEGNLFGELGGFIAAIGAGKLEDLDFNAYNHSYNYSNIVNSWNTVNGSGYYYPLIDYGTYSVNKINYDYRTFRPALYVKEYIDKIFAGSGYTYESSFFDSAFFKKLIIPTTSKELKGLFTDLLDVSRSTYTFLTSTGQKQQTFNFNIENLKRSFTDDGNPNYTYTGSNARLKIVYKITGFIEWRTLGVGSPFAFIRLYKNSSLIKEYSYSLSKNGFKLFFNIEDQLEIDFNTNDTFYFDTYYNNILGGSYLDFNYLRINSINPISTDVVLNNDILIKYSIPRNILQKDFFTWIMKMFNLYITEDKLREKHLLIEPYIDYYDLSDPEDWTYKVARDKAWNIKPMGMLNGRFFEYKYKDDNDFYNEGFKKKYNLPYGSILEDTKFQFAKEKQTIEIGFSPSVLIQYQSTDKVVTAIYKKSSGNSVDQEERMDSNIRILMAKKMTGVASWSIINTGANQVFPGTALGSPLTVYGYAGHFDDPKNPTVDINFGAAAEIYFDPLTYPSANLFNDYWSGYIAEIADKDSKLLSCHVYLNDLDIAQLDFSKPVFIDGVLWRINKIMDYDATSGELTKVELLKVIDTGFGVTCAKDWTRVNYTGTTFRNGDPIPQVTNNAAWAALTTPAWCHYNNDPANDAIYGKLYNWYAVNDPRGFAPEGYRVPTDQDWTDLSNCLGDSSTAGGKMKSTSSLWTAPNIGATNESKFNALPGGSRRILGTFEAIGNSGVWWSLTEFDATRAIYRMIISNNENLFGGSVNKKSGFSVRLIKEN